MTLTSRIQEWITKRTNIKIKKNSHATKELNNGFQTILYSSFKGNNIITFLRTELQEIYKWPSWWTSRKSLQNLSLHKKLEPPSTWIPNSYLCFLYPSAFLRAINVGSDSALEANLSLWKDFKKVYKIAQKAWSDNIINYPS